MMRITPLIIAEAALVMILAVCCLVTWSSGSTQRATGKYWRVARQGQAEDDLVAKRKLSWLFGEELTAVEALERFLEVEPGHAEVRLQLAGLYLGLSRPREAIGHYEQIAKDKDLKVAGGKKAADRLRALALVALGMIEARDGVAAKEVKKREAALAAAKARFEEAIRLEFPEGLDAKEGTAPAAPEGKDKGKGGEPGRTDKPPEGEPRGKVSLVAYGDACVGLGLIALWAEDFAGAEKWLSRALSGRSALGLEVIPEIYNGMGLVHAAKGDAAGASGQFDLAKRYRPKWDVPDRNKQLVQRGLAGSPDMDAKRREELLHQVAQDIKNNRNPGVEVLNLLGCGYYRLEDLPKARSHLEAAVKADPSGATGQLNLLAVRWRVLQDCRAEMVKAAAELFPAPAGDPAALSWTTPLLQQGLKPKLDETKLVNYNNRIVREFEAAEDQFDVSAAWVLEHVKDLPEALEQSLILVRLEAIPRLGPRLAAAKDDAAKLRGRAMLDAQGPMLEAALKKYPKEPRLLRLKGVRMLSAGEVKAALAVFAESVAAKANQPDVKAVQAVYAGQPEVLGFRPLAVPVPAGGPVLARSGRPLLGAVFRVYTGTVPLAATQVKVKLDGREVTGGFWGSEFLLIPEGNLTDGAHAIEAEAEDLLGRRASGKFQFLVDDSPPEITKTEPEEEGKIDGPRPKLVVHYADRYSGVDPASVEIELRSGRGAGTWLVENPVRGGRYTYDHPALGIAKGASVEAGRAVFCPTRDLGSGSYVVTVSVQDVRGLAAKKVWTFNVK